MRVVKWKIKTGKKDDKGKPVLETKEGVILGPIVKEGVTLIVVHGTDGFIHELPAADIRP